MGTVGESVEDSNLERVEGMAGSRPVQREFNSETQLVIVGEWWPHQLQDDREGVSTRSTKLCCLVSNELPTSTSYAKMTSTCSWRGNAFRVGGPSKVD